LGQSDNDPEIIESTPDGWIIDGSEEIGLALEVKSVKNAIKLKQLESHLKRIQMYRMPCLLVITPDLQRPKNLGVFKNNCDPSVNVEWQSWGLVYRWLQAINCSSKIREKDHFIVGSTIEYLERRREVLGFQGISFREDFNVTEAKDILKAEMEALLLEIEKLYPDLTKRRPAITTFSKEAVWDCFGNESGFTNWIHFSLSIKQTHHDIAMTVPNSASKTWKRLKSIASPDFIHTARTTLEAFKPLYEFMRGY